MAESPENPDAAPAPMVVCCNHPDQPATACCCYCKKPICLQCMEKFGFLCSSNCRREAAQLGIDVPVYEGQAHLVRERQLRRWKWRAAGIFLGLLALIGAYAWYWIWGCKPSVALTVPLDPSDTDYRIAAECKFIGPRQVLLFNDRFLRLYDTGKRKEIWKKDLSVYRKARTPSAKSAEEAGGQAAEDAPVADDEESALEWSELSGESAGCRAIGDRVWVSTAGRLIGFDRRTGSEQKVVTWSGYPVCSSFGEETFLVVAAKRNGPQTLTLVDLRSGAVTASEIPESPLRTEMLAQEAADREAARSAVVNEGALESGAPPEYKPPAFRSDFVGTGVNLTQFDLRLLEARVVDQQAMKSSNTSKTVDPNAGAANTAGMAEEILNEMQRSATGGVEQVDESRYAVTLRRFPGEGIPEWSGEVVGLPQLFAFRTVDLLVAGQQLIAFDKQNRKLWESRLAFPAPKTKEATPGVEFGSNLYFYDQGVLTAFDLRSGSVRWRLPSVGISKVQLDDRGMLYVTTTGASHESIRYSQQFNLSEDRSTVIVKVDPSTGKILWKIPRVGDTFYLSGKYVYATRAQTSGLNVVGAILSGGLGGRGAASSVPVHFRIYRIKPSNGKVLWEYYRKGQPLSLDFQGNTIAALYEKDFQLLRYLSF